MTTERDRSGRLVIGGVPVTALVEEYGTPLYIYDEATLRERADAYRRAFARHYPRARVVYAGKAYMATWLLPLLESAGLWLDVVSGGELYLAHRGGFPAERIVFHGNNKTPDELALALQLGIGEVVVDNHHELDLLERMVPADGPGLDVLLRVNPGIDAHTHAYRKTGIVDSKFGLLIESGDAARAVERIVGIPGLRLRGYHAHIGSQIVELEPFAATVDALFRFAAAMRDRFGVVPDQISPGGGFGIPYESGDPEAAIDAYAEAVARSALAAAERWGFAPPVLTVEPGRSIVGPAGVAVYRVGTIKDIPGVRRYVCVDGGMADNIRPALYGARYTAALANRTGEGEALVTIAGKYCESGDVLIKDIALPTLEPGDLIALPAAGAYCLAMASNYNLALRPAVVAVAGGEARLVQRRERYEDLLAREALLATPPRSD
ncbi:MAG: diaminopimelate decarboxylase [Sphaerobacter sp.]|nr:diaminopimelate decarboxylase [Sphaerobacter sp.]